MLDHEFKLKPSKHYIAWVSIILLASIIIMLCLQIEVRYKLVSFMFVGVYGGYIIWKFVLLRSAKSIVSIRRHRDGRWRIYTPLHTYDAELRGDSTVTGLVSILRFRVAKRFWPVSCIVFQDSLEPDRYRQLIVVTKMK